MGNKVSTLSECLICGGQVDTDSEVCVLCAYDGFEREELDAD